MIKSPLFHYSFHPLFGVDPLEEWEVEPKVDRYFCNHLSIWHASFLTVGVEEPGIMKFGQINLKFFPQQEIKDTLFTVEAVLLKRLHLYHRHRLHHSTHAHNYKPKSLTGSQCINLTHLWAVTVYWQKTEKKNRHARRGGKTNQVQNKLILLTKQQRGKLEHVIIGFLIYLFWNIVFIEFFNVRKHRHFRNAL